MVISIKLHPKCLAEQVTNANLAAKFLFVPISLLLSFYYATRKILPLTLFPTADGRWQSPARRVDGLYSLLGIKLLQSLNIEH